jgi:hypothetical protein
MGFLHFGLGWPKHVAEAKLKPGIRNIVYLRAMPAKLPSDD